MVKRITSYSLREVIIWFQFTISEDKKKVIDINGGNMELNEKTIKIETICNEELKTYDVCFLTKEDTQTAFDRVCFLLKAEK